VKRDRGCDLTGPGGVEEFQFVVAADELSGCIFGNAGYVGFALLCGGGGEIGSNRPRFQWLDGGSQRSAEAYHFPKRRLGDERLACQFAVQALIPGIGEFKSRDPVARVIAQRKRDEVRISIGEQDWNETCVPFRIVDVVVDDRAFPEHATPLVGWHLVLHTLEVGLGADHEHEVGVLRTQLLLAPVRPTFRRPHLVAVEFGIHAVAAQGIRELEHPFAMLR
jgi:hypothetical protein